MAKIQLVTNEGCKQCTKVKRILADLRNEIPMISIEEIDFTSEQGVRLAIEYQILSPPAVFIDGKLIFKGEFEMNSMKEAVRSSMKTRS